ncbi:penicillin acylase family protein [Thermaurantiacus sp.]
MRQRLLALLLASLSLTSLAEARGLDRRAVEAAAARYEAVIGRDRWGVPRVHGRTDADAAFALGYALAEDDLPLLEQAMAAGNLHRLTARSREEAQIAYLLQLFRVPDQAEAAWARLLPETRAYLDAYAEGINLYAARHPHAIGRRDLFPLSGKDVLRNAIFQAPLFYGLSRVLSRLVAPERERSLAAGQGLQVQSSPCRHALLCGDPAGLGSNAFAVAPTRSADGATRLIANSHQPLEGILAWIEASVSSDEGLEFTGGLFPGSPVLLLGANPDLAWAATVNRPDLIDTYRLEVDPKDPSRYRLDGSYRAFETGVARIRVRAGPVVITVRRPTRWSAHGPVLETPDGPVAIRWAGMDEPTSLEASYRLMRARSVAEARAILAEGRIPSTNRIMADRHGAIARYYLARMPKRPDGPDWQGLLPGDDSRLIWTAFEPFEALPHLENPPEGWLTEANASPFHQMGSASDPDPARYPARFGIETDLTNRARRATARMRAAGNLDRDELWAIKMDDVYDPAALAPRLRDEVLRSDWAEEPALAEAVALLRAWDLTLRPGNRSAALAMLAFQPIGAALFQGNRPPALKASLEAARDFLLRHHGRLDVPWSEVNRLHRNGRSLPMTGGPDVLRAMSSVPDERTGTLRGIVGDSLVIRVEWDRAGRQTIETVSPYGAATGWPSSPHHMDQMELFVRGELKAVPPTRAERAGTLLRCYRPGGAPAPCS